MKVIDAKPEQIVPTMQFVNDMREWRASRPAWASLLKGIRQDAERGELDRLAEEAGASASELLELIELRRKAKGATRGGELRAVQKRLAALDREAEELLANASSVPDDIMSQRNFEAAIGNIRSRRLSAEADLRGAQVDSQIIDTARAHGVF